MPNYVERIQKELAESGLGEDHFNDQLLGISCVPVSLTGPEDPQAVREESPTGQGSRGSDLRPSDREDTPRTPNSP